MAIDADVNSGSVKKLAGFQLAVSEWIRAQRQLSLNALLTLLLNALSDGVMSD